MIDLRPYQIGIVNEVIENIETGYKKILIVQPMASGKSITMGSLLSKLIIKYDYKNNLILVPFLDLRDQIIDLLPKFGIQAECLTYHSAMSRLTELGEVDTLIYDECHHCVSPEWKEIANKIKPKLICGFTGTPFRIDSCPLLEQNGGLFEILIDGPDLESLIKSEWLADYDYYIYPLERRMTRIALPYINNEYHYLDKEFYVALDRSDNAIIEYTNQFKGMQGIVFCRTVEHASIMSERFSSIGISAANINCYRTRKETKKTLQDFKDGKITILAACNMASEGLDIPHIKLGIMARKISLSLTMYLQQIGRFLRPYNGEKAKLLDLASNYYRFGDAKEAYRKEIV